MHQLTLLAITLCSLSTACTSRHATSELERESAEYGPPVVAPPFQASDWNQPHSACESGEEGVTYQGYYKPIQARATELTNARWTTALACQSHRSNPDDPNSALLYYADCKWKVDGITWNVTYSIEEAGWNLCPAEGAYLAGSALTFRTKTTGAYTSVEGTDSYNTLAACQAAIQGKTCDTLFGNVTTVAIADLPVVDSPNVHYNGLIDLSDLLQVGEPATCCRQAPAPSPSAAPSPQPEPDPEPSPSPEPSPTE